ncbi:hypothetical protein SAG0137_03390 [Streptococcus agalactiae LMG 14838]|uniref:SseB family protein n=1 Tax=Streptococcus agalactiae TaxID=1311 RepID=UPI0002BA01B9|nr:SseB family protein [Streptococcus agalactiae]EPU21537.1 hypothetical protein SAG0137_03390 [Streptococcus agalactiae LMG 14838]
MTSTNELDIRLRAFINAPDNFLDSIGLVNALHHSTVWASKEPYAIQVDGQEVVPVFTDITDLNHFKEEQESARDMFWESRRSLDVLDEAISHGLSGLVYNLKKEGDFGNSTIFYCEDMVQFMHNYTTILNQLLNEDNIVADIMDKTYLVPAFVHPREEGSFDRFFPTMSTPEGKSYVPVFSNLLSFEKWYNHNDFGGAFRKAQGVILAWTIDDIYKPRNGENEIDDTFGVAINPFDEQQVLVDWSDVEND